MYNVNTTEITYRMLSEGPKAYANMLGGPEYTKLSGTVLFYGYRGGSIVVADMVELPTDQGTCRGRIFGFHIHDGQSCTGDSEDPFRDTGLHYNPDGCAHPEHAGDMPVLFENKGKAWMAFYTDRFTPEEIRGKTVVLHDMPDDFRSQPSGGSGSKIACGVIR